MQLHEAFVLGTLQGVTEFLPVSSSAHLVLFPWLLKWQDPGLAFDVFLHLGTLAALVIYFFKDLLDLIGGGIKSILERRIGFEQNRQMFWMVVVGTIPAVIAGVLLNKFAETHFRAPLLIAMTLSLVGFIILWVDGHYPTLRRFEDLRMLDALLIGCAQAFAIIPGVSRSGATMGMARRLGLSRDAAARFSFLLCMPIIFGAVLMESRQFINEIGTSFSWDYVMMGFGASFFFGLLSIHFMLTFLRNADLAIFTWYRIGLSIVVVVWSIVFKV